MPGMHSSIIGGSTADRMLECPASFQEALKSPMVDMESVYASEGTALHEAVSLLWLNKRKPASVLGQVFYGITMTEEHVEVLGRALKTLTELLDHYEIGRVKTLCSEEMLALPGVTGAFGSVDLLLSSKEFVVIPDWKFGAGVPVKALYERGEYDVVNPQLAFYATAARGKYRRHFRNKRIVLAVIQPRLDPPLSHVETTNEELDQFLAAFQDTVLEAMGRDPRRARGDHCRFALCKATCPLWTGPVLDLAAINPIVAAQRASVANKPTEYGEFLSRALTLGKIAETWSIEITRQAHVFLEDGGVVPDWKIVPKRATRKWVDPDTAAAELRTAGALKDDIWSEPELRSVTQVEKRLKTRNLEVPGHLFNQVSSGTTIAPADDARQDVSHEHVVTKLRESLKSIA